MYLRFLLMSVAVYGLSANSELFAQPPDHIPQSSVSYGISSNFENSFNSGFDEGGKFSYYRAGVRGHIRKTVTPATDIGLNLDYSLTSFDFSGDSGFGALDPWSEINRVSAGIVLNHRLNRQITLTAVPIVRFTGETGADFSDSLTYTAVTGVSYAVTRDLVIGTGIIATTRLGKSILAFPGAMINWRVAENTTVSTLITGVRTELGPNLKVIHEFTERLKAAVNISYEFHRFRLDDSGGIPGGIGDLKIVPVWASVGYRFNENITLEIYSGTGSFGRMKAEQSSGERIIRDKFDQTFFIGTGLRIAP